MSENIIDKSPIRRFEKLSEKQKKQVEAKLSLLDYMDLVSIIQFGSDSIKEIMIIQEEMISRFKAKNFEEVHFLITNLIKDLKNIETENLLKKEKKRHTFIRKKVKEKVTKLLIEQISNQKAIEEVEDKLIETKILLMGDMEFCFQMIKRMYNTIKKLEIEYNTIQIALKKANAEKEQLEEFVKQEPNNLEYSYKISELSKAIKNLERKAINILVFGANTFQGIKQIRLMQEEEEFMVSKIEDAVINIIPSWKRNFEIALAIFCLNNANTIEKIVKDEVKNKLLTEKNEILKDSILESTEEMEKTLVDAKTLRESNDNLKQAFEELSKANENAKKVRKNALNAVKSIRTLPLQTQNETGLKQMEGKNGV